MIRGIGWTAVYRKRFHRAAVRDRQIDGRAMASMNYCLLDKKWLQMIRNSAWTAVYRDIGWEIDRQMDGRQIVEHRTTQKLDKRW